VAMSLYHGAKKSFNEEGQNKNYIVLKTIFQKNEETQLLFKEVEAFIKYKPISQKTTDVSGTNRVNLKRKLNENE
jgi:hypothetical protein